MPDFIDLRTLALTAHIFGAILGAGGAFASDTVFLNSVKDGIINVTEIRFIKLSGKLVWAGVILLIFSGAYVFYLSPEEFLASSKFLAKMSIVGIILLNGIVFHTFHIPLLGESVDMPLKTFPKFMRFSNLVIVSGAVSMTSWIFTVALGVLKILPYSYGVIMLSYLISVIFSSAFALLLKKKLLHL